MSVDPELRKQLEEARDVLRAEIEEIECRAKNAYKGMPPDYRSSYAELQKQLSEIDDILGQDD